MSSKTSSKQQEQQDKQQDKKQEQQMPVLPTFSFDIDGLQKMVETAVALDKVIATTTGTIGAVMADARTTTLVASPRTDLELGEATTKVRDAIAEPDITWSGLIDVLDAYRAVVQARFDEAVTKAAGSKITDTKTARDHATGLRTTLAEQFTALHTLLKGNPDAAKITFPKAPGKRGSTGNTVGGTTGGTKTGGSTLSYYRVMADGTQQYLAKGSPLSLVAFRWFDASADDVRAALLAAGGSIVDGFDPVDVTVTDKSGNARTHKIGAVLITGNGDSTDPGSSSTDSSK